MIEIVERFTTAGQVILDPFLGGGTTGVAALRRDRIFIGADINATAVETTRERLAAIANEGA